MNKTELVKEISKASGISIRESRIVLNSILKNISKSLKEGTRVSIMNFGTWSISEREERKGRNPQTGREIIIGSKKVVKFKPSLSLVDDDDDTGPLKKL